MLALKVTISVLLLNLWRAPVYGEKVPAVSATLVSLSLNTGSNTSFDLSDTVYNTVQTFQNNSVINSSELYVDNQTNSSYATSVSSQFMFNLKFQQEVEKTDASSTNYAYVRDNLLPLQHAGNRTTLADYHAWLQFRLTLTAALNDNDAAIIYHEANSTWVFCTSGLASNFVPDAAGDNGYIRLCLPYSVLGLGNITRTPVSNKDYVPQQAANELRTLQTANITVGTALRWQGLNGVSGRTTATSEESCETYDANSTMSSSSSGCVSVDLLYFSSDEYSDTCLTYLSESSECYALCCLSLYADSAFCRGNPVQCA